MLIRNAKDTAGKPIEVWLRGDKIAAIGQGRFHRYPLPLAHPRL